MLLPPRLLRAIVLPHLFGDYGSLHDVLLIAVTRIGAVDTGTESPKRYCVDASRFTASLRRKNTILCSVKQKYRSFIAPSAELRPTGGSYECSATSKYQLISNGSLEYDAPQQPALSICQAARRSSRAAASPSAPYRLLFPTIEAADLNLPYQSYDPPHSQDTGKGTTS